MATEEFYNDLGQDIKRLEEKVQDVFYLGQFEKAKEFRERLFKIEKIVLEKSYESGTPGVGEDSQIIFLITRLEEEINEFLVEHNGTGKVLENVRIDYNIDKKISQKLATLSTSELWSNLSNILSEWKKTTHNDLEEQNNRKKIRKAVLDILISSAKKGESIDLIAASKYCSTEDLIEVMQNQLIEVAQKQQQEGKEKESTSTLGIAKTLQKESINSTSVWKLLTDVPDVKVKGLALDLVNKNNQNTPNTMALAVIEPKNNFFDRMRKVFGVKVTPKTTIYTFGDINPETGEWENLRAKADIFPKKLSKRQKQRLLAVEINDVDRVGYVRRKDRWENPLEGAYNLQKVIFGRVQVIGNRCFQESPSLSTVEFSDNVQEIESHAFNECEKLANVKFGKNIRTIESSAFKNCVSLQTAILPERVKTVCHDAFNNCHNLTDVDLPGVETIGYDSFEYCHNLRNLSWGDKLQVIGSGAFRECTSLKSIYIPKSIREIYDSAFRFCEQLADVSFDPEIASIIFNYDEKEHTVDAQELNNLQKLIKIPIFAGCKALQKKARDEQIREEKTKGKAQKQRQETEPQQQSPQQDEERDER